jgi:protein O-GlcNAc transferase
MSDQTLQFLEKAQNFKNSGDFASAREWLEKAVRLDPDNFEATVNLSEACRVLGDDDNAIHHLSHALKLRPGFYAGHNSLGVLFRKKGDFKAAILALNKAVDCNPDFFEAYYNLGNCMRDLEEFDGAIACFERALALNPRSIETLSNLGEAFQISGRIKDAERCFKSALDVDPACSVAFSNYLLTLNYDPDFAPRDLYREHKKFGAAFSRPPHERIFANDMTPARRLRVGYVSADFRGHPVSGFLLPVLRHHHAIDFDVFCYSGVKDSDAKTDAFRRISPHWTDVTAMPDTEMAEKIRTDGIDILVDLSGHSADNRLPVFALKPAPVQVTYLGYPNTTGMAAIDYRITDRVADPLCEVSSHTERLVRISPCFCCLDPIENAPVPGPLPALRNGGVTFGSTHMLARLNDGVLDLWASLLERVPLSRLVIMRTTLKGTSLARVLGRFEFRGIDTNRIIVRNTVSQEGHLAVYREIDIFLDTFPWSGHTTSCEALWMGIPVVTLLGNRHASRMVASVLSCMNLKEHIAGTTAEYLSIAGNLAGNLDILDNLRGTLRDRMAAGPLCDGKSFTASLEQAYRTMWRDYCGK